MTPEEIASRLDELKRILQIFERHEVRGDYAMLARNGVARVEEILSGFCAPDLVVTTPPATP